MNAIVCLTTISALFLGFCDSSLTKTPSDSSVLVGDTVTLECVTEDKTYPPTWSHQKVGSTAPRDVSLVFRRDGVIVTNMMEGYNERHEIVEYRETGEYSLKIRNAKAEDAGVYSCTSRGGLGQKASAKLTVFESSPECACNNTEVLGENSCNLSPDYIEYFCKFRVHSNTLPKVIWAISNRTETVTIGDTTIIDDNGYKSSRLIIRGDRAGLDETSFKCILVSAENANNQRFSCVTPKITVLKITNTAESKTLTSPEEVECTPLPKLHAVGYKWVKRDDDDREETVVSNKQLLNLHRSDMEAGTYTCIITVYIRGSNCPVEALSVIYQPEHSNHQGQSGIGLFSIAIVAGCLAIAATVVAVVLIWKRYRTKKGVSNKIYTAPSNSNGTRPTELIPLSDRKEENPRGSLLVSTNLIGHESGQTEQDDDSGHGSPSSETSNELISSNSSKSGSDTVTIDGFDHFDAKFGGPGVRDRARLAELRALERMKRNAEARQAEVNQGFSPDDADADVAEGLMVDKKKTE